MRLFENCLLLIRLTISALFTRQINARDFLSFLPESIKLAKHVLPDSDNILCVGHKINGKKSPPDCVILGNGPSLNDLLTNEKELEKLENKDLFCVNMFVNSEYFEILKPSYYVIIDPAFYHGHKDVNVLEKVNHATNAIVEKTHWPLVLITSSEAINSTFVKKLKTNIHITIKHIPHPYQRNIRLEQLFYNKGLFTPKHVNVMVAAIYSSISLNYSTIYLTGVDHSWHNDIFITNENKIAVWLKHFDSNEEKAYQVHDHPSATIFNYFTNLGSIFYTYHTLENLAKQLNCKIINCSKNSFIDAFERGNLI